MKQIFSIVLIAAGLRLLGLGAPDLVAQQPPPAEISLDQCQELARKHYPLLRQKGLLEAANQLAVKNLGNAWLPQLDLNLQASYQSDVTAVPIEVPGFEIPTPPKDQYRAVLNVNQAIYEGGMVKRQKEVQKMDLMVGQQEVEVELYKIRQYVDQTYFAILMLQENDKQLAVYEKELKEKLDQVKAGIEHGVLMPSNGTQMEAEILRIKQKQIEVSGQKKAMLRVLGQWTGQELSAETSLQVPVYAPLVHEQPPKLRPRFPDLDSRPETQLFTLQRSKLSSLIRATRTSRLPRVGAFAQGGFSRPGLNMLEDSFEPWYIVGVRASWNIWDWNRSKVQREIYGIQRQMVDLRESAFTLNTRRVLSQQEEEIQKLRDMLAVDEEIITLRTQLKTTASKQLDNGVITATDYLEFLNQENLARLNRDQHTIQLLQTQARYHNQIGK